MDKKRHTKEGYRSELALKAKGLRKLVVNSLRELQEQYDYFANWRLRQETQEGQLGDQGYIWALHAGDRWVEVVLTADLVDYLNGAELDPYLTVRAQVHEPLMWGHLLAGERPDRDMAHEIVYPLDDTKYCEEALINSLNMVVRDVFSK